ncbi:mechanosensitive ion channel family protein [Fulvivirga maritima]|uniref:mechanosensitive ion channel family protein n=1 Tax=Fulvivirga maritima TaxID=2904247 RepID=UPI001F232B75|nr:mechanosensitive ion channel domain-containing protein [Fulvivirga maritima]UII28126.1 mechanosensitive ion channel family protein [Fulvivirga maritima]
MDLKTLMEAHPIISAICIFILAFLFTLIGRSIMFKVLKHYTRTQDRILFGSLKRRLQGSLFLFFPCIVLHIAIGYLYLDPQYVGITKKILEVVIIISIAIILIRLIGVVEDVLFAKYDMSKADNLKARKARTQIIYVKKMAMVVVAVIAVAVILLSFDSVRKYGATILTGAGVAGIIIGFALQKTLANLFAGIQIAFTQPIKIDDAVVLENEWGWIEEINLTYVVVRIWDMRRLVLPITYFTETPFQNWTRTTAQILGTVFLYVDYTLPLDPLRKHFEEVLAGTDLWDKDAKAFQITDTSERTMTVRLLMTAKNSPTAFDLRCHVREHMIDFIQKNYPQCLPQTRAVLGGDNIEDLKREKTFDH